MNTHDVEMIRSALSYIPNHDRDTWIRVGMAMKHALGDAGWPIWNEWSQGPESYREKDARIAWRNFKLTARGGRPITIGTLYFYARQHGWQPTERIRKPQTAHDATAAENVRRREEARAAAAVETARRILSVVGYGPHPYMAAKGFPDMLVPICMMAEPPANHTFPGQLVIALRVNDERGNLLSLQLINGDGEKRFLPGSRISGGRFHFGHRGYAKRRWYCEGYATAHSLRAAMEVISWRDPVIVCFSDHGLRRLAERDARAFVIADNDVSGAGKRAAEATGRPYWMPPDAGTDFNDYHRAHGIEAAVRVIRKLVAS